MREKIKIPQTQKKCKYIKARVTIDELTEIKIVCKKNKVTITDLVKKGISYYLPQIFK